MATDRIRALGDRLWGSFTAAAGGTSPDNQELEDDGLEMQVCYFNNFPLSHTQPRKNALCKWLFLLWACKALTFCIIVQQQYTFMFVSMSFTIPSNGS